MPVARHNNLFVELDGERVLLKDAAARFGLNYHTVWGRIYRRGVPVLEALTTPPAPPNERKKGGGMMLQKIRLSSELRPRDLVKTPSGRAAMVKGFVGDRVALVYVDDGDDVDLAPHRLTLVSRASKHQCPDTFLHPKKKRAA